MPLGFCRTRFVITALACFAALAAVNAGCGGGAPAGDTDKLQILQSQFDITVINAAGKALFEVKAEIEPTGPASHFTTIIARMENGEKRVLAHNVFTDRDGVPFSARNIKAKGVIVTAKDMDGKPIKVEVPWQK
jgi:hypothetical protein